MRAWAPDHPAPLDGAGGGDLPSAVEAVAPAPGVRVLQVLGHQLQALLAAGYLVGFISVDGVSAVVRSLAPASVIAGRVLGFGSPHLKQGAVSWATM